jgi:hypothetical protein
MSFKILVSSGSKPASDALLSNIVGDTVILTNDFFSGPELIMDTCNSFRFNEPSELNEEPLKTLVGPFENKGNDEVDLVQRHS